MAKEYIEREAAIEAMYKDAEAHPDHTFWATQLEVLMDIPAADVRPVGLLEQVEWERDTALAQLAEIGKSLGEKMDDVRPVVLCGVCELHGHCYTEDVFAFARLAEENRFCAVGKVKTNGEKREES